MTRSGAVPFVTVKPILLQFPSAGISLGEVESDWLHISTLLRNTVLSACEGGVLSQYTKNLVMVIVAALLLVIVVLISSFWICKALSDTGMLKSLQSGSTGATGVLVGVGVSVAVDVAVKVSVCDGVSVRTGIGVAVRVLVRVGTGVLVRVLVGTGVRVNVGGPAEGVQEGRTKLVKVGKGVADGRSVGN